MNILRPLAAVNPTVRLRIWSLIRRFVPARFRWLYEGGQLALAERELLYKTIRRYKPQTVFEVGTWLGAGSTYFIARALHDNGSGVLHTIECDPEFHAKAVSNYERYLRHLLPYVRFHVGASTEVYPSLLSDMGGADAVFLDGGDDPLQSLREFQMFEPHLKLLFTAHDWYGEKMAALRPLIEGSAEWRIEHALKAPYSTGFVVAIRRSPPTPNR